MVEDRKASTPRLEEASPPTKIPKDTKANCFGLDDSTEDSDSNNTTLNTNNTNRESLVGISPVRGNQMSKNILITPAPNNKTCSKSVPNVFKSEKNEVFNKPMRMRVEFKKRPKPMQMPSQGNITNTSSSKSRYVWF